MTALCSRASTTFTLLQEGDPIGMLLFDYLVHEGHWNTAKRVAQDILLGRVQVSEKVCHVAHRKLMPELLLLLVQTCHKVLPDLGGVPMQLCS